MSGSNGNGAAHAADFVFSTVRGIKDDHPSDTTFSDFMEGIRDGKWKSLIVQLRSVHADASARATAEGLIGKAFDDAVKNVVRPLKTRLPGACFSGTFSYRDAEHLIAPSGLICADLDHLNERVESVRDLIAADPHTLGCAISPSGTGLKVIFRIDPARPHLESFYAAEHYVREHFGEEIDGACKEINRLCFVTYDPDAFIAADALVLPYPPPPAPIEAPAHVTSRIRVDFPAGFISPGDDYNARGDWQTLLANHGWKKAHEPYWTRPGKDGGVSASWGVYEEHFHVFTDSAAPLVSGNYRPFALYSFLVCGGDFQRACDELYDLGYGTRRKIKQLMAPPALDADIQARLDAAVEGTSGAPAKPPIKTTEEERRAEALKNLRALCYAHEFNFAIVPPKPIPRFLIKGSQVCTPGNLTSLTGQAKTAKSATIDAMIASIVVAANDNAADCDCLGFSSCPPKGMNVIHFDSEQVAFDHDQLIRRSLRRARAIEKPAWLRSFCLTGFSILDRRRLIRLMLEDMHLIGGTHSLFLDGVADCVVNVNDADECNPFIAELQNLAIEFNCPIINVIHENPGQDIGKMRGHLGSGIERKAESCLRLKKTDDVITLFSDKMRHGLILEKDGPQFSWDTEAAMHMSRVRGLSSKDIAKRSKLADIVEATFHHSGRDRLRYGELIKAISEVAGVGASRAEVRYMEMKAFGLIDKDLVGFWSPNVAKG